MTLYDELKWRGLIKDEAGDVASKLNNEKITFYWGTDPTADSLHIGHYSSLVTAKRLALAGHHPILLIGGATALIGDPNPNGERQIIDSALIQHNVLSLTEQVSQIFDHKATIVNNNDWMKDYHYLDFLRDYGKYINVNYMINKDIINRRLETGISYAEFSYTLIQGYDFYHLFTTNHCVMQVEGSDQWGNITTGIDLIKKITGLDAYAFTMPLVLDKDGHKFGKTAGNALWLDKAKTSSYELYQYLINTDDSLVISYLKIFTFLTPEAIMALEKEHQAHPELRLAQQTLAREIITDLHGKAEYEKAKHISEALFSDDFSQLSMDEIKEAFQGVPSFKITSEVNIVSFLVDYQICSSKREAREFITAEAISLNGHKVVDMNLIVNRALALQDIIIVKRGKKNYFIGSFK